MQMGVDIPDIWCECVSLKGWRGGGEHVKKTEKFNTNRESKLWNIVVSRQRQGKRAFFQKRATAEYPSNRWFELNVMPYGFHRPNWNFPILLCLLNHIVLLIFAFYLRVSVCVFVCVCVCRCVRCLPLSLGLIIIVCAIVNALTLKSVGTDIFAHRMLSFSE